MNRSTPVIVSLALMLIAGCSQEPADGTSVGNPGMFALVAAAGADDLLIESVVLRDALLRVYPCASGSDSEDLALGDFVGGSAAPLPAGRWCRLEVKSAGGSEWEVEDEDDLFEFSLTIPSLDLQAVSASGFEVDEDTAYILELASPGWIDEEHLGEEGNGLQEP
jgi:hypothetical protein